VKSLRLTVVARDFRSVVVDKSGGPVEKRHPVGSAELFDTGSEQVNHAVPLFGHLVDVNIWFSIDAHRRRLFECLYQS
jgi:hypothetical protein